MKTQITLFILLITAFVHGQTVTTVTDGNFYDGLGIDSAGNIYCSNFAGNDIFKYELATGTVTTFASGFVNPNGIGVTDDNRIYICEAGAGAIRIYDTDGNLIDSITGLNNPTGIKYDALNDRLLWVSYAQKSLNAIDPDTNTSEVLFQGAPLQGPSGIAFVGDETYISNYDNRKIFKLNVDDTLTEIAQIPASGAANNVLGFLTAKGGYLYGTQIGAHRIYRVNPIDGSIVQAAGSSIGNTDGSLDVATFNLPNGILGDDINDRIYISDAGTSNLRIIENASLNVDAFAKAELKLNLFPNPTKDTLTVSVPLGVNGPYTLTVFDAKGSIIHSEKGTSVQNSLPLKVTTSTWSNGTFIVVLRTDAQISTGKLIK
jgi:YD repeat-containing protein